jgi:hypothetical protein
MATSFAQWSRLLFLVFFEAVAPSHERFRRDGGGIVRAAARAKNAQNVRPNIWNTIQYIHKNGM